MVVVVGVAAGAVLMSDGDDDPVPPPTAGAEIPASPEVTAVAAEGGTSSSVRVAVDPEFSLPRSRIPKDGIPPIYDPEFVSAGDSPLEDSSYVMGVAIEGEAHAYPVSLLNGREMVNDVVGGIPLLVTW